MAHRPVWVCLRRGRKEREAGEEEAGVVESVLVPMASTAIVTHGGHPVHDRPSTDERHERHTGTGTAAGPPAGPRSRSPAVVVPRQDRRPSCRSSSRWPPCSAATATSAATSWRRRSRSRRSCRSSRSSWWPSPSLGFVAAGSQTDVAGRLVEQLGLQGESAKMMTDAVGAAESSRKSGVDRRFPRPAVVGPRPGRRPAVRLQLGVAGQRPRPEGQGLRRCPGWPGRPCCSSAAPPPPPPCGGCRASWRRSASSITFAVSLGLWLWTLAGAAQHEAALAGSRPRGAARRHRPRGPQGGRRLLRPEGSGLVLRSCTARSASSSPSWPGCCSSAGWWCTRPSSTWSATSSSRARSGRSSRRRRCPTSARWPTAPAASWPPTDIRADLPGRSARGRGMSALGEALTSCYGSLAPDSAS